MKTKQRKSIRRLRSISKRINKGGVRRRRSKTVKKVRKMKVRKMRKQRRNRYGGKSIRRIRRSRKLHGGNIPEGYTEISPCSFGYENLDNYAITSRFSDLTSLSSQARADREASAANAEAAGVQL
jgi:hypothetical protein